MNILTRKIRRKNYTLLEFCEQHFISLRTYRRWEKEDHAMNQWLVNHVDELEGK